MEYIVILGLIAYIAYKEYLLSKERKDIYDRLMTKSLSDYKYVSETPEENQEDEIDPNFVDIPEDGSELPVDMKEEIMYGGKEG
jgi:hypothetical protein